MTIETPTGYFTAMAGTLHARDSVRRIRVTPCGDTSDPAGGGLAIQLELASPPAGGLATLMLSRVEARALGSELLQAAGDGAG